MGMIERKLIFALNSKKGHTVDHITPKKTRKKQDRDGHRDDHLSLITSKMCTFKGPATPLRPKTQRGGQMTHGGCLKEVAGKYGKAGLK